MGNKIKIVKLGDLYLEPSRNGLTKPKKIRGRGFKFINMGEIFEFDRMLNIPCDRVPLSKKEAASSLLQRSDLLFARQSLVLSGAGKCSIFLGDNEPVTFESHLIRVRLDQAKIIPEYIYYFFKSPQGRAEIGTIIEQGAGQAGIRGSDLAGLKVFFPSILQQKLITKILSSLDDKIELNRQMNTTLESMAQAMFKSWFVNFDPVIDNALTAGNPIPEPLKAKAEARRLLGDQRKPLPQEIQELFPDSFVFTEELGWIPEGWEAGKLSDIAELKTQSVKPDKKPDKMWDHFSIPAFDENKIPHKDIGHSIKSGKYTVPKTSVLASKLNPQFPRVWLPEVIDENSSICSTEFMPFIPLEAEERSYLYTFFCSEKIQAEIANRVTGSTGSRQRVKPKEIAEMTILKAPQHIRTGFSNRVSSLFFKQANNINEQTLLSNLRDALLPKLISGQLRLPDSLIDKFAEQADSHDAEQIISEAI